MQKEAQALLDAAIALQKAGAKEEMIRFTPYVNQGLVQVTFSLPIEMVGMELKLAQLPE